jgi:hypothetical protein
MGPSSPHTPPTQNERKRGVHSENSAGRQRCEPGRKEEKNSDAHSETQTREDEKTNGFAKNSPLCASDPALEVT